MTASVAWALGINDICMYIEVYGWSVPVRTTHMHAMWLDKTNVRGNPKAVRHTEGYITALPYSRKWAGGVF